MDKITSINEELKVKQIVEDNKTNVYVIDGDKETLLLSDMKNKDNFWTRWVCNDYYIVAYSRGCMIEQIPIVIESAYSIKDKKLVDLSNYKIKELLEYMIIMKKGFDLSMVLSEINTSDLGLLKKEEKPILRNYLTSGNNNIPHEDIVNYILKSYPELKKYKDLNKILSVLDYRIIEENIDTTTFWFHSMPQDLSFIENKPKKRILKKDRN